MYKIHLFLIFLICRQHSIVALNFKNVIVADKFEFYEKLRSIISFNNNDQCALDVEEILTAVKDGKEWAIRSKLEFFFLNS